MSVILSLLGILVAAAGVAAIGFGIPINEFPRGTTLIVAGVSALTGGLILIGLAAVVAELGRLSEAVRTRVVARPGRPAEASEPVQPAAPALVVPPAPVVGARPTPPGRLSEAVRTRVVARPGRPAEASEPVQPAAPALVVPPAPVVGARPTPPASPRLRSEAPESHPAAEPSAVDVPAAAGERLHSSIARAERAEPSIVADDDEVPLSPNGAAHVQTQRRNFDAVWPTDARPGRSAESGPSPAVEAGQRHADDVSPEPVPAEEPRGAAAILKSGVVDGLAYTLYADGSIEAKLPHGTVRFGSIAELRAHIGTNS
jgi:hypothetical protein